MLSMPSNKAALQFDRTENEGIAAFIEPSVMLETTKAIPLPKLSLPDFLHSYAPAQWAEFEIAGGWGGEWGGEWTAWLDATERNVGQSAMIKADGTRVFDRALLFWSLDQTKLCDPFRLDDAGGVPMPADAQGYILDMVDVEVEENAASGAASPEQTDTRKAIIAKADERLREMGFDRAAERARRRQEWTFSVSAEALSRDRGPSVKNEMPHNAAMDCTAIDSPAETPRPRLWTILDYFQQFEPSRLLWIDTLDEEIAERLAWLTATEHNVYQREPTLRADGERLFDIGLLFWSTNQSIPLVFGLNEPGGISETADELLDFINEAENRMDEDAACKAVPPEQTAARRKAIIAAERRLLDIGVCRAEVLARWRREQALQLTA